jgi:hypothetical protein
MLTDNALLQNQHQQPTKQTNGLIQFNLGQLEIKVGKWNKPFRKSPQGVTLLAFSPLLLPPLFGCSYYS